MDFRVKMLRRLLWSLAVGLTLAARVVAGPIPDWSARIWQADDGLPDNRIAGLVQKPNGEFWTATRGGLARFNGLNFEVFQLDAIKGVTGNGARAMFGDSRGRLWIGAYRDVVVCLGRDQAEIYGSGEGIPTGQLNGIAEAGDGTVWLAIGNHLGWFAEGRFRDLAMPAGPVTSQRAVLCEDIKRQVWGFANGQLGLITTGGFETRARLEYREVVICGARTGGIWLCADAGVYRLEEGSSPALKVELPSEVRPMCILEDREGAIWVGTVAHGLFRCAGGQTQHIETAAPQVGQLLEDHEGNIWAGTYGGGLHRLQPRAVELLSAQAGLPTHSMVSVCQDSDGNYWAASASGHLVRGDGRHWSAVPAGPLWTGVPASCVAAGPDGKLWVGTRGQGLVEVNLHTGAARKWTTADGLPSNSMRGLFTAADGSLWFTGNTPSSLGNIRGDSLRCFPVPPSVRNIRAIVQDASGTIWVGTSDGQVLKVAEDKLISEAGLAHMVTSSVRALHATPEGSLWIGFADQGLGHYRDGRFTAITTANGLVENAVWQIVADRQGSLWLAGARALYRLPLAAVLNVAGDPAERLRPLVYKRAEGLPNPQPHYDNTPAVCVGQNGTILFSTGLGLLALYPETLRANRIPPTVIVERVTVDEKIVAIRDSGFPLRPAIEPTPADITEAESHVWLPPDHRRLTIDFSALSYTAPENIRYRYRLEGADDAWIEPAKDLTAHYSRLPAGNYRFRAIASNDAGIWNETGATLAVTVGLFFWQTWWFRLAAVAGFTGLVVAIVRLVSFRRLQARLRAVEQERALLQERTRIARDIHDDLGGSLTHIKLLSELAVQDHASREGMEVHVRQITNATQAVMKSLDEIVWAVNPRNDTLPHLISYLGQYAVEFMRAAGIACAADLPEDPPDTAVPSDVRHHLFMVLKEALTNIVRHAGARIVRLRVELPPGGLRISVHDDGQSFVTVPDDATADGLRNMRQRMEAVGGEFRIEAKPGHGTRLEFTVPLKPGGG